jgi:mRNA-degrading endonuclease RelE of RelBE toxin-antitoxin system
MKDQDGMRAVVEAVEALAVDPYPPEGFHRGDDYHRIRVGPYRVMYAVEGELITVWRVDRA